MLHSDSSPPRALRTRYWSSWNNWICSYKIYGKWSIQASKQASIDTHTRAQCSYASVEFAQARPNYTVVCNWTLTVRCVILNSTHPWSSHASSTKSREGQGTLHMTTIAHSQGFISHWFAISCLCGTIILLDCAYFVGIKTNYDLHYQWKRARYRWCVSVKQLAYIHSTFSWCH